jgi:hypothetical protein
VIVTVNHRFLRGKIVDKEQYDQWKEQNQGVGDASMQMIDLDVEIHASSFHIPDDDEEKLYAPSSPNEGEEKDCTNLLMKTYA